MEDLLFDIWLPFNGTQEGRWKDLNSQLEKTMTGLGISEVEKRQVVAAMGEAKGHWYSCPNGHVYNIGDCGGATVVANCPDCNARLANSTCSVFFRQYQHQDRRHRTPPAGFKPNSCSHGLFEPSQLSVGTPGRAVSVMECKIKVWFLHLNIFFTALVFDHCSNANTLRLILIELGTALVKQYIVQLVQILCK